MGVEEAAGGIDCEQSLEKRQIKVFVAKAQMKPLWPKQQLRPVWPKQCAPSVHQDDGEVVLMF